jgi:hypothetical protein
VVTTAYACGVGGGVFKGVNVTCSAPLCADPLSLEIAPSKAAAQRFLQQGLTHSIELSYPREFYRMNHSIWDLLDDDIRISPMIQFDARWYADPEAAAIGLIDEALECKDIFETNHPGKPFNWSVRWAAFGGWYDGQLDSAPVPKFSNHPLDCRDADFPAADKCDSSYHVGGTLTVMSGPMDTESRTISGWNKSTQIITLSSALPAAPTNGVKLMIDDGMNGVFFAHVVDVGTSPTSTSFRLYSYPRQLSSHHYIPFLIADNIGTAESPTTTTFVPSNGYLGYYDKYEDGYFTANEDGGAVPAIIEFASNTPTVALRGVKCDVIGWNQSAKRFTVGVRRLLGGGGYDLDARGDYQYDALPATPNSSDHYVMTRPGGVGPVFFFKNGAEECDAWTQEFIEWLTLYWPVGLESPNAVVITTEDLVEANHSSVRFSAEQLQSEYEMWLNDPRADDPAYTIDGTRTLAQWDSDFRYDKTNTRIPLPQPYIAYDPRAEAWHSYLMATLQTAYDYHRWQSTWQHLHTLWPDTHLPQYQIGNTIGTASSPVPLLPGEVAYHGQTWQGAVTWDDYGWILFMRGGADAVWGSTTGVLSGGLGELNVKNFTPGASPVGKTLEFYAGPYVGQTFTITAWNSGTSTLTLSPAVSPAPGADEPFLVIWGPSYPYWDYDTNAAGWDVFQAFIARAGETADASGFVHTAKRWANECAKAQTRAFPNNPYSTYYSMGPYDGNDDYMSQFWCYPTTGFALPDGTLSGTDWGEIGAQAVGYGVNHFAWFQPLAVKYESSTWTPQMEVDELETSMQTTKATIDANIDAFKNIACPADFNADGYVTSSDIFDYMNAYFAPDVAADMDGDGVLNITDFYDYLDLFYALAC